MSGDTDGPAETMGMRQNGAQQQARREHLKIGQVGRTNPRN